MTYGPWRLSKPRVLRCAITSNDSGGVNITMGGNPIIHGCRIFRNALWGVYSNNLSVTVDATGNWWGHESGPKDESAGLPDFNPCGQGDKVSDYVSYRPWQGDPNYPAMFSGSELATAYNNGLKLIRDGRDWLHAVYRSGNSSFYSYSTNGGSSWASRELLGEGGYPALTKDEQDSLYVSWIRNGNSEMCWVDTLSHLFFSLRDQNGTWLPPCTLAIDRSTSSPQVWYSPPSLVVVQHTARVVYERTELTIAVPWGWNMLWRLYVGTFPVRNPQAIRWQALDTLYLRNISPPPPTPVSPSVSLFMGKCHVVWVKQGEVYYREQIGDTAWLPILNLSQSPDSASSHPSSYLYGNRLSSLWEEALGSDYSVVYYRSRLVGEDWGGRSLLSGGLTHAHVPSVSGNVVASWGEALDSLNSEIYYTLWDGSAWSAPENFSNTLTRSSYPHLLYSPDQNGVTLSFLWTEGSLAPYDVRYGQVFKPLALPPPWYSADVGKSNPSPFTVDRDGYLVYGSLPYQTIDYDHQKLIYRFPGLDTASHYHLRLVAYFEKKAQGGGADRGGSASSEASDAPSDDERSSALEKGGPKIKQTILLNGLEVGTMDLEVGIPDTFDIMVPDSLVRGGTLDLVLDKKNGRFACLSEIALYRWRDGGKEVARSQGAPQSGEGVELLPKVYDLYQSYPNPARDGASIRYALPKASQVSLSVYNITGQLIRRLVNTDQKAGYHAVRWDGRDEYGRRVSNGVYLYRMEAGEFRKTRKLVVVR